MGEHKYKMNQAKNTTTQQDLLVLISLMDTYERLVKQRNDMENVTNSFKASVFTDASSFVLNEITDLMQSTLDKCKEEKARFKRLDELNLELPKGGLIIPS